MGHATNIYGIISWPSNSYNEQIWQRNIDVIQSLPDNDKSYPHISNKMFSKEFQPGWDERHIHFAANYKNLEFELQSWVDKFEILLSKMMWLSATAHIETEISGDFEIYWNIDKTLLMQWKEKNWIPTAKWISKGLQKKYSSSHSTL